MQTRALFFDIDGTLVSFKTHRIPQSAVDDLRTAHDAGVKIFISTGRPVKFINNLSQISDLIDGYITTNGAYCFVGNVEVSLHYFLQEDVERILNYCDRHDVTAMVVGMHSIAAYRLKPVIAEVFGKGLGLGDFHFDKLDDVLHEPILQITPFLSPEQEAELMPSLKAVNSGRWTDAFTDLTHCDADKGKGLEAMAAYLNISLEQTMAFGDGGNDVSILRKAGVGVAMGNARDGVKAQADYVTTSVDDDGVRNALRHFGIVDCPTV